METAREEEQLMKSGRARCVSGGNCPRVKLMLDMTNAEKKSMSWQARFRDAVDFETSERIINHEFMVVYSLELKKKSLQSSQRCRAYSSECVG